MSRKNRPAPVTVPAAPLDIDSPGGFVTNVAPATLDVDGAPVTFQPGELAKAHAPPAPAEAQPGETVCINRKCRSTEISDTRPTQQRMTIGGKRMMCVIKVCEKCRQRRGEWIPVEATNGGR